MQPTVDADLRAIRAALERIVSEEDLPTTVVSGITEVIRSVKRLERSWFRVLPHLAHENESTAALLNELAPLLPADLNDEIEALLSSPVPSCEPDMLDARKANELNTHLRDLLARAIRALPDEEAPAARTRVSQHFRDSLELRPW